MSGEPVRRRDLMKTVGAGAAAGLAGHSTSAKTTRRSTRTSAKTMAGSCSSVEHNLNTGYHDDFGIVQGPGATEDDWQITYDEKNGPASVPRMADVVDSGGWPDPFPDSAWISIEPDQGSWPPEPPSFYEYTYCFCLHPEFENPELDFTLQADDEVDDIRLNGQSLPFTGNGNFQGGPIEETYTDPDLFVAGENCLTIRVVDTHQVITGMNLVGTMTADNADCDCCVDPCEVAVRKEAHGDFKPGTANQYVIQVCNTCPNQTCDAPVEVTDEIPDALEPIGASGTGWTTDIQDGTLTAIHENSGGLDPGACLPDLVVDVEVPSLLENCAEATVPDYGQSATDCAEHEITTCKKQCRLALEKTVEEEFCFGDTGVYALRVCNEGGAECDEATVIKDPLPAGLTPVSASGTGWSIDIQSGTVFAHHDNPGLAPGDCLPVLYVEAEAATEADWPTSDYTARNCAELLYGTSSSDYDCVEHEIYNCGSSCTLSVNKSVEENFCFGGTGVYAVEVCNAGDTECASGVELEDPLPDGIRPTDAFGSGWSASISNGTVSAGHANGGLAPGECLPVLYIEAEVVSEADWPGDDNVAENCVEIYYGDGASDSDCVQHEVYSCDGCTMAVDKQTESQFYYGEVGTYVVRVCNAGDTKCDGVVELEDNVPDGMEVVDVSGSGWSTNTDGSTVWAEHTESLAPGECLPTLYIDVQVATMDNWPSGSDQVTNCAQVYFGGNLEDEGCVTHVIYA